MITVYKFHLRGFVHKLLLPEGSKVLHAHPQTNDVCIWVLQDPDKPKVTRTFVVVGTGFAMPEGNHTYIGTCHVDGFVWHIFEQV